MSGSSYGKCAVAGVLLLAALTACGVSKQYVGANARTIRQNAELTKKSLAQCLASNSCAAIAASMTAGLDEITERANAMCAIAEPECDARVK